LGGWRLSLNIAMWVADSFQFALHAGRLKESCSKKVQVDAHAGESGNLLSSG